MSVAIYVMSAAQMKSCRKFTGLKTRLWSTAVPKGRLSTERQVNANTFLAPWNQSINYWEGILQAAPDLHDFLYYGVELRSL